MTRRTIVAAPDIILTVGLAIVFFGAAPAASAQTADLRLLSLSCAGCHGPAGHSPGNIPSLYGRSAASIAESLRAFRSDLRPSTVMGRVAKGYTDAEIAAVAQQIAAAWQ